MQNQRLHSHSAEPFLCIHAPDTAAGASSRLVSLITAVKHGALPYRVQHVKRRVLLSKAATGGAEAPGCALEEQRERAEVDRSKGTAMLSALASGGSLNLSQELVLRDCCFKWKQGIGLYMHCVSCCSNRDLLRCPLILAPPPHPTPPHSLPL